MNEFFFSTSDTLPRLEVIVSGNGAAVDLTDSTGNVFIYRSRYSGTINVISGQFANKGSGIVYVDLTGSSFSNNMGPIWGKFIIYFINGGRRSYPSDSYINIDIISGLV